MPARLGALLLAASLGAGCGPGEGQRSADREALRVAVASDERVVAALHRVDDLALAGKPGEAAALLTSTARPASAESVARVEAMKPATPWGVERHREASALIHDRAASLDRYQAALQSEQIARLLEALEEQKKLDQRGAALAGAVLRPAP